MGLIGQIFTLIFGGGRNAIRETAEVFRENAEGAGVREAGLRQAVMQQFAAEFSRAERGWFDRLMDAINRIPRPALALGTLALFLSAMFDPIWFSARMQGIALVPQPLWWLLGVIVSFYFGARHQQKNQDFQRSLAQTMARAPQVMANIEALGMLGAGSPGVAQAEPDAETTLEATRPESTRAGALAATGSLIRGNGARHVLYRARPRDRRKGGPRRSRCDNLLQAFAFVNASV